MTNPYSIRSATYEQFKEQWLSEVLAGSPSTIEKGLRFGSKLITQRLGVTTDDEALVICDGAGDGGIDIAYLKRRDVDTRDADADSEDGDTWYIVQSKYGSAFAGYDTIREEGRKAINTLLGLNVHLSDCARQVVEKINVFRTQATEADRIVLVFATTDPIARQDRNALDEIKFIGRDSIGGIFDVEEVSLMTIYEELGEVEPSLSVPIKGQFVDQYDGLLIGAVSLIDLFDFMRAYQRETGNLDQLYERNVRQFLGNKRKINKEIAKTLHNNPERFGLYNNGITIVASSYSRAADDAVTVSDPYIVNGCQTTRTIWQTLDGKLNAGGSSSAPAIEEWKDRARKGGVVTKIVRGEADITNITRYTNSQNAVRQQDFITLEDNFKTWAAEIEREHRIFLEIQRGGIESRKAYEKQHPDQPKCIAYVNAFDLIKVYGAGWLAKPGVAFGKNAPFLPSGSVYEKIIGRGAESSDSFGTHDLHAAYQIKRLADGIGFGRGVSAATRRQSRFLFYYVIIDMLKNIIALTPEIRGANQSIPLALITNTVHRLTSESAKAACTMLSKSALGVIDQYLVAGSPNSAHNEPPFNSVHNGDLNAFLKAERLGEPEYTPLLTQLVGMAKLGLSTMPIPGSDTTGQALIVEAILAN